MTFRLRWKVLYMNVYIFLLSKPEIVEQINEAIDPSYQHSLEKYLIGDMLMQVKKVTQY